MDRCSKNVFIHFSLWRWNLRWNCLGNVSRTGRLFQGRHGLFKLLSRCSLGLHLRWASRCALRSCSDILAIVLTTGMMLVFLSTSQSSHSIRTQRTNTSQTLVSRKTYAWGVESFCLVDLVTVGNDCISLLSLGILESCLWLMFYGCVASLGVNFVCQMWFYFISLSSFPCSSDWLYLFSPHGMEFCVSSRSFRLRGCSGYCRVLPESPLKNQGTHHSSWPLSAYHS